MKSRFQTKITPGALTLFVATVTASLAFGALGEAFQLEMLRWVTATSNSVWTDFKIWQLITTSLVPVTEAGGLDIVGLLFTGLMLWTFLPTLEGWWGKKRFLLFALWTSLAGNIAGTAVGVFTGGPGVVSGLDPFVFASILSFGILWGNQPVRFFGVVEMKGKQLAIGITALTAIILLLGERWAEGASIAAAMLLGWLMVSGKYTPKLWYLRWKQKRLRKKSKMRIVKDDDEPKLWN